MANWCYKRDPAMSAPVTCKDVPWQPLPNRLLQRLRRRCATFLLSRALPASRP